MGNNKAWGTGLLIGLSGLIVMSMTAVVKPVDRQGFVAPPSHDAADLRPRVEERPMLRVPVMPDSAPVEPEGESLEASTPEAVATEPASTPRADDEALIGGEEPAPETSELDQPLEDDSMLPTRPRTAVEDELLGADAPLDPRG